LCGKDYLIPSYRGKKKACAAKVSNYYLRRGITTWGFGGERVSKMAKERGGYSEYCRPWERSTPDSASREGRGQGRNSWVIGREGEARTPTKISKAARLLANNRLEAKGKKEGG